MRTFDFAALTGLHIDHFQTPDVCSAYCLRFCHQQILRQVCLFQGQTVQNSADQLLLLVGQRAAPLQQSAQSLFF